LTLPPFVFQLGKAIRSLWRHWCLDFYVGDNCSNDKTHSTCWTIGSWLSVWCVAYLVRFSFTLVRLKNLLLVTLIFYVMLLILLLI